MTFADNSKIFVVVPSFNEAKQLRHTLAPLIEQGYSVVVVDDFSTDSTAQTIQDLPIYYLRHPINLGQGAALQTGMNFSVQQNANYIVHFDADGQHNFREIPLLINALQTQAADVALGTRFKRAEDVAAIPTFRRFVLRVAILVNGIMTGLWLSDAHNGFRAFTKEAAAKIKITENRMAHATEILSLIKQQHLKVVEVPVHIEYTDYSKLKGQSSSNSINILIDLILNKLF
jgi:glycosyltransferase involved in cell wall biosynthesis